MHHGPLGRRACGRPSGCLGSSPKDVAAMDRSSADTAMRRRALWIARATARTDLAPLQGLARVADMPHDELVQAARRRSSIAGHRSITTTRPASHAR